jgi:hypothetical protein
VRQAIQECAGGDDHGVARERPAIAEQNTGYPASARLFDYQLRYFGLENSQIGLALENFAHLDAVLLLIALRPRRPNRWTPAGVQQPKLDTDRVGYLAHHTAQRVDLAHQMSLCDSTDRGIAGHLGDQVQIHRDHARAQTHSGASARGLAAGMSCAYHDHVVSRGFHQTQF